MVSVKGRKIDFVENCISEIIASSSNTGKNNANLNQMVFTETTRQRELKSLEKYSALLMSKF